MDPAEELKKNGFTTLSCVMDANECAALGESIEGLLSRRPSDAIESDEGGLVGGRNLIDRWSAWQTLTEKPLINDFIREQVGLGAGVVRILFFDKPPGRGWSLSLHRDQTIAVAAHQQPCEPFAKPTTKAGVPHVQASEELLREMLTLRLHLDAMHDRNGPLVVIPGSHIRSAQEATTIHTVHCGAGDVFVMRPLLSHGSRAADPKTEDHRRVLHIEIAPRETLPGNYRWHRFEPIRAV